MYRRQLHEFLAMKMEVRDCDIDSDDSSSDEEIVAVVCELVYNHLKLRVPFISFYFNYNEQV